MSGAAGPSGAAARPVRATLAAVGVNLAGVLPLFLTGGMAVQIGRDLGFGPAGVGAMSATYAIGTMVGSAPLGGRVGRIGVRRALRTAGTTAAAALVAAALAPAPVWLAAALLLAGLANALGQPAGNAMVAGHVPRHRFGLAFAIKQSGIPVATLLAGLAVPTVALTVGWRHGYAIAALLALASAALPPPDRPLAERRPEHPVPRPVRPALWALALGLSAAVVAATSIGAFGATAGVAVGLGEGAAGLLVAAGGLAGLTIRLLAGVVADRVPADALTGVAALIAAGALGWGLMAFAFGTAAPAPYIAGLLLANAFGWGWPGLLHLAVARRFPTATAAASGVTQTGVSAGLLLGPLLLGLVITRAGWFEAWALATGAALAAAAAVLLVRQPLNRAAG
jgi:MFS family permease